jgi:hypothetical protein
MICLPTIRRVAAGLMPFGISLLLGMSLPLEMSYTQTREQGSRWLPVVPKMRPAPPIT